MRKLDPEWKERMDTLMSIDREAMTNTVRCSFLAGMQLAIRICRNRASDCKVIGRDEGEPQTCASLIRICQVEIGSGRMKSPKLTDDELEEMDRIA